MYELFKYMYMYLCITYTFYIAHHIKWNKSLYSAIGMYLAFLRQKITFSGEIRWEGGIIIVDLQVILSLNLLGNNLYYQHT